VSGISSPVPKLQLLGPANFCWLYIQNISMRFYALAF